MSDVRIVARVMRACLLAGIFCLAFSAEVCEVAAGEKRADRLADGDFATGCNYWASHAGMHMWRNWDGAQVEKDLAALKATGVDVMRVVPLWQDFQPLTTHLIGGAVFREMAQADGLDGILAPLL